MKLRRETALIIHRILDGWLPPWLRDSRWFMALPLRLAYRHRWRTYLEFRDRLPTMTEDDLREAYRQTADVAFERPTDLNQASIDRILEHVRGPRVLEAGCGKGHLVGLLAGSFEVSAVDFVLQPHLRGRWPQVQFHQAELYALPFADAAFDTVVCTHTLEHVLDLPAAIAELRRVARRLIVVVPRQRPYRYTFDLHIHFFPYPHDLLVAFGRRADQVQCEDVGGDLFYLEDVAAPAAPRPPHSA